MTGQYLIALSLFVVHFAIAEPSQGQEELFSYHGNNISLKNMVEEIASISGRVVILDRRLRGKATIIGNAQYRKDELWNLMISTLAVHGYIIIPAGKKATSPNDTETFIVTQSRHSKQSNTDFYSGKETEADELTTLVYGVTFLEASSLVPILRPLVPRYGHLSAARSANALIMVNTVGGHQRILSIINELDKQLASENAGIEIITLQHASASEAIDLLDALFPDPVKKRRGRRNRFSSGSQKRINYAADERNNSIILTGDKSIRSKVKAFLKDLDAPAETTAKSKVIALKYQDAESLATLLDNLFQQKQVATSRRSAIRSRNRNSRAALPSNDKLLIKPFVPLNQIILRGDPSDIQSALTLIKKLDIKPKQVALEMEIVEVSYDSDFALSLQASYKNSKEAIAAGVESNQFGNSLTGLLKAIQSESKGNQSLANGISIAAGELSDQESYALLLQNALSESRVNLISKPKVFGLNQSEIELTIGQNVPFVTGQNQTAGNDSGNPFSTITRKDVGLVITATPNINAISDEVTLDIEIEISSIEPSSQAEGAADIITNERKIQSALRIADGETTVIGGLLKESLLEGKQAPLGLNKVPVIKHLVTSRDRSKGKSLLMVFITPTIDGTAP